MGLLDTLGAALMTQYYTGTLSPQDRAVVAAAPHRLFQFVPVGRHRRGALPSPLCMPLNPLSVGYGTGLFHNDDGYLYVHLGYVPAGPGQVKRVVKEYAHRLLYGATQGGDWRAVLGLAPNAPVTRWEVSHMCGNAWCLNPSHLVAVTTPRENVITMAHLRPMQLV